MPFKANTQQQSKHLSRGKWIENASEDILTKSKKYSRYAVFTLNSRCTRAFGVDELLSLLANYSRNELKKKTHKENPVGCLTVGVVGLPNTGKSAIINTLKRQKVCASGNVPGITRYGFFIHSTCFRQCQRIRIDKDLFLIDSPGIVISASADQSELVLRNCVRVSY